MHYNHNKETPQNSLANSSGPYIIAPLQIPYSNPYRLKEPY